MARKKVAKTADTTTTTVTASGSTQADVEKHLLGVSHQIVDVLKHFKQLPIDSLVDEDDIEVFESVEQQLRSLYNTLRTGATNHALRTGLED